LFGKSFFVICVVLPFFGLRDYPSMHMDLFGQCEHVWPPRKTQIVTYAFGSVLFRSWLKSW